MKVEVTILHSLVGKEINHKKGEVTELDKELANKWEKAGLCTINKKSSRSKRPTATKKK